MKKFLLLQCSLMVFAVCLLVKPIHAEDGEPVLKQQMRSAYTAFEQLQTYLISERRFSDEENEAKIASLLNDLSSSFSESLEKKAALRKQPGFGETLSVVTDRIKNASMRFSEGRKGYALWELKTVGNYCVSCHITYKAKSTFSDPTINLSGLTDLEKAEFFLATRQFDKAVELFKTVVYADENPQDRMFALRKWLIIHIRVYQDPAAATIELDSMLRAVSFSDFERKELHEYRESMRRWAREPQNREPSLRRAENLLRQSLGMNDLLDAKESTVELLRATAILHSLLEDDAAGENSPDRGRILYLLGLCYSKLPLYFVNELPEFFLELCIRENPNQKVARSCYRLLSNDTYLDFTGSGGMSIPADVQANLDRLYAIAFGK